MLKIEESKKQVEYKGEVINLKEPSAEKQTDFALSVKNEDDHKGNLEKMIDYVIELGIKKSIANKMTLKNLGDVITYVHGAEKK